LLGKVDESMANVTLLKHSFPERGVVKAFQNLFIDRNNLELEEVVPGVCGK
jgi:hypothetical protein